MDLKTDSPRWLVRDATEGTEEMWHVRRTLFAIASFEKEGREPRTKEGGQPLEAGNGP